MTTGGTCKKKKNFLSESNVKFRRIFIVKVSNHDEFDGLLEVKF